jgi:hypothetical protein
VLSFFQHGEEASLKTFFLEKGLKFVLIIIFGYFHMVGFRFSDDADRIFHVNDFGFENIHIKLLKLGSCFCRIVSRLLVNLLMLIKLEDMDLASLLHIVEVNFTGLVSHEGDAEIILSLSVFEVIVVEGIPMVILIFPIQHFLNNLKFLLLAVPLRVQPLMK